MDLRPGAEFAGYVIEGELGRGGMGVVYLAEQRFPKRKVALKVLAPELARDERFRDRFVRESNLAASLDHPNIVPIHAAGEEDGVLYLAMRYVEGTDLKQAVAQGGPLSLQRTAAIVAQVASALDAAHRRGMVHRDVKASNVLLVAGDETGTEHAYLSDFGLTKRMTSDSGLTGTGQFVGTLDYAAPEQFEGKPLDARTDVYSLGCVAYECLVGEVPFHRETEAAVVYAHLQEPPPKVTATRPDLPAAVDEVVARAMAKSPADRYETAGALARDLARVADGSSPHPPAPASASADMGPATRGRRVGALLAGAVGSAVVVAIVLAVALGSRHRTQAGNPPSGASTNAPSSVTASPSSFPSVTEQTVKLIDPATNRVSVEAPVPQALGDGFDSIVFGEGGLWVVDHEGSLVHLDPDTGKPLAVIRAVQPFDVAVGDHTPVWATFGGLGQGVGTTFRTLVEVDPAVDQAVKFIPYCEGTCNQFINQTGNASLAIASGSVWVVDSALQMVWRFDEQSGARQGSIRVPNAAEVPRSVVGAAGAIWVLDNFDDTVVKIDPSKDRIVDSVSLAGASPVAIGAGAGSIWVLSGNGTVTKIDPSSDSIDQTFFVAKHLNGVAVGDGSVWIAAVTGDGPSGTVFRYDVGTLEQVAAIPVGGFAQALAVTPKGVWVTIQPP
jgi:serine/threonine protein kinase